MLPRDELRRIARFILVGITNVAINYCVFAALILVGFASVWALLAGTVVSVAVNYVVGGRYVFGNRGFAAAPRFLLVYCLTYALNALGLVALEHGGVRPLIGQIALIPPVVALTYVLLRCWAFPLKTRDTSR